MIHKRTIHHTHQSDNLESILVLPQGNGPFPAVLLVHEYTGLNRVTVNHAERLAAAGYAVLAADFYGVDNRPASVEEANISHRVYRNDRLLMRERAKACLHALTRQKEISPSRVFALGFSFGAGAVLELARTGADLKGAVSVYGYLDTTHPAAPGEIKCPLLAILVEDDPVVPRKHVEMFEEEMKSTKAECEIISLKNAMHGFANPDNSEFDADLAEKMWKTVLKKLMTWNTD
ncbi:dienelactone hydrolase family protein [Maridesulfovibrio hydrothermalis]|uniref:Dienelactone hydrolase n=1 Tax=Maridesulfovibrio hydrothermalis AM13 = DSM 14728 TaxID=1121451 RepID=L0R8R8_9BACT|nr:dienelactone hydrolase family protein [Maridesulfovibrio hydrothermalis]CCO23154.1 Dienelactone hydrolase [Maridesulfovibrio hydrothermalis AM13 = DSM 14728]